MISAILIPASRAAWMPALTAMGSASMAPAKAKMIPRKPLQENEQLFSIVFMKLNVAFNKLA